MRNKTASWIDDFHFCGTRLFILQCPMDFDLYHCPACEILGYRDRLGTMELGMNYIQRRTEQIESERRTDSLMWRDIRKTVVM